jgi:hypothetical protein
VSRYDSSSHQALSSLDLVAHRYLADVQVTSQTLHLCSGYRYLYNIANATTYSPVTVNQLAGVDVIREDTDPFPQSLKLWITAVDSASMYDGVNEQLFNKDVEVFDSWLDPNAFTVVHTPQSVYKGKIDEVTLYFNDKKRGTYYELSLQTELRREPPVAYFDQATLWKTYSGDTFFSRQHLIATTKAQWGKQPTQFPGVVPGGPSFYPSPYRGSPGNRYGMP